MFGGLLDDNLGRGLLLVFVYVFVFVFVFVVVFELINEKDVDE